MTMLPDNEVVIKYIEEYLHGVIPEDYREPGSLSEDASVHEGAI